MDREVPVGVDVAAGAAVVIVAAFAASAVPAADGWWRVLLMAAGVAIFAAATGDMPAVAGVVVLAWLVVNGFLVDRYGQLAWHGDTDLVRLLLLTAGAGLGVVIGRSRTHSIATKE